jgi:tenascin
MKRISGTIPQPNRAYFGNISSEVTLQFDVVVILEGRAWGLTDTQNITIQVICGDDYYGTNCASFDCLLPCENNGECVAPNVCDCTNSGIHFYSCPTLTECNAGGYLGPTCIEIDCAISGSGACMNGGWCYDVPGTPPQFLCDCTNATSGYYGPTCEDFDCNGNLCQNNGTCIAPDVCDCVNGYYGNDCSEFDCNGMYGVECV